jgi:hypothetical protein
MMLMVSCSAASAMSEHHEGREAGGDDGLPDHAADGAPHEDRLIGERIDQKLRRQLPLDALQLGLDAGDDVQRGGRTGLHDAHEDGAASIHAHDVGLRGVTVAHMGHVADIDDRPVDRADGQVVQLIDDLRSGVGFDRVLEAVDLHGAGGNDQILRGDGVDHIDRRKPLGLQRVQVQIHLNLARLAAVGEGRLRALDGGQRNADGVRSQVVQLLLVQPLTREAEHQHGHAGGVVLHDERRRGARWQ